MGPYTWLYSKAFWKAVPWITDATQARPVYLLIHGPGTLFRGFLYTAHVVARILIEVKVISTKIKTKMRSETVEGEAVLMRPKIPPEMSR